MPLGSFRLNGLGKFQAPTGRTPTTLTAVGNTQISTAQSRFGGSSVYFDGNGDYLYADSFPTAPIVGDYTIEFWFRLSATNREQYFINNRWNGSYTTGDFTIWRSPFNGFIFGMAGSTQINYSVTVNTSNWYHLAAVRSSGVCKLYIDGTAASGTMSNTNNLFATNQKLIMGVNSNTGSDWAFGYMDEIRISNIARYTSNFTPSSSAFVNDANTLLLLHMDGTNGSTTFTDDTN